MTHLAVAGRQQHGSDEVEFCSYCGRFGGGEARVCANCGLGVRLRASAGALKSEAAAFLIVRADGIISAVSAAAEREIPHDGPLLERPLLSVLTSEEDLASAVARAAGGAVTTTSLVNARGLELRATITPCGEPPAALVVVTRKPAATARS